MSPIPADSSLLAMIDEAKWQWNRDNTAQHISLRWSVVEPETYKNRKIFQKLWVSDLDPSVQDDNKAQKKRDKALQMLAAIDANCGGKLSKKDAMPNSDDLTLALTNRLMVIKVQVWEIKSLDGSTNSGNWISAVAARTKGVEVKEAAAKPAPRVSVLDGEVPF